MKPAFQFTGLRQGRISVVSRVLPNAGGYTRWLCRCDCGKETVAMGVSIKRGLQSCGCLGVDARRAAVFKHGARKTGAYESWAHMIQRCTNPNNKDFSRYGGRGITVCDRWKEFSNFFSDMGDRAPGLTLDRIDNRGNYEPENCRWADRLTQGRNRDCVRVSK